MKKIQKLILPLLLIAGAYLIYSVYFTKSKGLGSFSDFDPNNNAVKDIRVVLVIDRGITSTPDGGAVFFAEDRNKSVVQVNADKIPSGLNGASIVVLKGHLTQSGFHAHAVEIE
ncbi:MAG: hypothetical protein IPM56_19175 [Ignavibacteriales bacterium]|nr:MAG: hypothetical protein IPM56_19175 [Ignavibacteriales bacterium]